MSVQATQAAHKAQAIVLPRFLSGYSYSFGYRYSYSN